MNTPQYSNQQGDSGRTVLWVSELPDSITEPDLEAFFAEFKDSLALVQINRQNRGGESFAPKKLTATVIFKDPIRANEARLGMNLRKLRGKTIRIMWHEKDNSIKYNTTANLFIKGISSAAKPRELFELFLQFGDIISAKVGEDENGNNSGYAYVSYYDQNACEKAIGALNGKEFKGNQLEVVHFTKKNERQDLISNKNLYVKNLPSSCSDSDIKALFEKFGQILWSRVMEDNARKFAIIAFETEDSASIAKEKMNGFQLPNESEPLYVDMLQKKSERKRTLTSKINENNFMLNSQYKNCNLHIRNLPYDLTEEKLHQIFSVYGEIKSVKIPKYILITKEKDQFVENPTSKGFGYVCYTNEESAQKAIEETNGRMLESMPDLKRPLLVDLFQPKMERNQMLNKFQQNIRPNMMMMPPYGQMPRMGYPMYPQEVPKQIRPNQVNKDEPNLNYMRSLEDISAQREYLGEFLFKKIIDHPVTQKHGLTIDSVGRITGMILGIEDLNEIVDITMNYDNLTQRITEALSLLESQNQ